MARVAAAGGVATLWTGWAAAEEEAAEAEATGEEVMVVPRVAKEEATEEEAAEATGEEVMVVPRVPKGESMEEEEEEAVAAEATGEEVMVVPRVAKARAAARGPAAARG
jgi:hypothetical protein